MACQRPNAQIRLGLLLLAGLGLSSGCVERIMKIDSDPQGARVFINDEEVGVTPAKFAFLWYGDYDVILSKSGYETLKTRYRIAAPWYQYPPMDIVAECLVPTTIRDEHELPFYTLEPMTAPPMAEVVERAEELRDRALFGEP